MSVACPYVGLYPFTGEHQRFFFGRDKDIRVISYNLGGTRLTVLYGASGTGKSSVLQAGVVPELRKRPNTAVVYFRNWHGDFLNEIAEACRAELGTAARVGAGLRFHELLVELTGQGKPRLLLILDQFEEYLRQHSAEMSDVGFDGQLASVINDENLQVNVLLGLRDDDLWTLDNRLQPRIAGLLENTLRLEHLDEAAARLAIRAPLEAYAREGNPLGPIAIEDALVERILTEVRPNRSEVAGVTEDRVEAPYLQLILTKLWMAEGRDSRTMRLATINRSDVRGTENIVFQHLSSVLEGLSETDRQLCDSIFPHMVTPTGAKIPLRLEDLCRHAGSPGRRQALEVLLARLADEKQQSTDGQTRILRRIDRPVRYEVFHDVLGKAIQTWTLKRASARSAWRRARYAAAIVVAASILVAGGYSMLQRNRAYAARTQAELNAREATLQRLSALEELAQAREQIQDLNLAAQVPKPSSVSGLLIEARRLQQQGKVDDVARVLQNALEGSPDAQTQQFIYTTLGQLNRGRRESDALNYYLSADKIAASRKDVAARQELAAVIADQQFRLKRSADAISTLERATKLAGDSAEKAEAWTRLADAKAKDRDYPGALSAYQNALSAYGRSERQTVQTKAILIQIGSIYNKLGVTGKANEYFDRAERKPVENAAPEIAPPHNPNFKMNEVDLKSEPPVAVRPSLTAQPPPTASLTSSLNPQELEVTQPPITEGVEITIVDHNGERLRQTSTIEIKNQKSKRELRTLEVKDGLITIPLNPGEYSSEIKSVNDEGVKFRVKPGQLARVTLRPEIDIQRVTDLAMPLAKDLPQDLQKVLAGRGNEATPINFDALPTVVKADYLSVYVLAKDEKFMNRTFFDYFLGFANSPMRAVVDAKLEPMYSRLIGSESSDPDREPLLFVTREGLSFLSFKLEWKGSNARKYSPIQRRAALHQILLRKGAQPLYKIVLAQ